MQSNNHKIQIKARIEKIIVNIEKSERDFCSPLILSVGRGVPTAPPPARRASPTFLNPDQGGADDAGRIAELMFDDGRFEAIAENIFRHLRNAFGVERIEI
jgi:hypothetical protein